jgi:hypothetical protein
MNKTGEPTDEQKPFRKGVFLGAYVSAELKESLQRRAAAENRTLSQEMPFTGKINFRAELNAAGRTVRRAVAPKTHIPDDAPETTTRTMTKTRPQARQAEAKVSRPFGKRSLLCFDFH